MTERLQKLAFAFGLLLLAYVWGVATVEFKVFPHRLLSYLKAGVDAWGKFEDETLPRHALGPAAEGDGPDPVRLYAATEPDDLILMTAGFFYRMDLCPRFGCMAMVMDRTGHVLHKWEYDPQALFDPQKIGGFTGEPDPNNIIVQGTDIDPDGNLIVTLQGRNVFPYQVGVAKFAWDGTLRWVRIDNSHHWPKVGPDGRIYTPIARVERDAEQVAGTRQDLKCRFGAVFQEGVQILAPDGTVLRRFWMDDVVRASDRQGLAYSVRDDCDPYHVNGIDLVTPALAERLPGVRAGDLVLSLRSSSALVILDHETGALRRIINGPMVAQHSPNVLADGSLAVFDNLGGIDTEKGTRILRIDPVTGADRTLFPVDPDQPGHDLFSDAQGAVAFSRRSNRALVSESLGGRVFEIDVATGRTLWEFHAVSDLAPFLKTYRGQDGGPRFTRLQTQGARYIGRADVARFAGGG